MSPDRGGLGEPIDWRAAAQGDIVAFDHLVYWTDADGEEWVETPHGIVLLSQTCDLVQDRERVLIAPVVEASPATMSLVKKGSKPLLIPVASSPDHVADLERIISVPRSLLHGAPVLHHAVQERSGEAADRLSARIGRSLHRFAFPDAVNDSLGKMKKKIADAYSKDTSFARVLHLIDEFRISCMDWEAAGRDLSIIAIVPEEYLPAADSRDANWQWSTSTVATLKNGEVPATVPIERVSELILNNLSRQNDAAVVALWELWIEKFSDAVVPAPTAEVASVAMDAVSDVDYTYKLLKSSETLDFSVLSSSEE